MIVELGLEHRGARMRISAASHVPECHYATRRDDEGLPLNINARKQVGKEKRFVVSTEGLGGFDGPLVDPQVSAL
jgi:hypothetical protein